MSDAPAPPQSPRRRTLWITLAILFATMIGSAAFKYFEWKRWEAAWMKPGIIEPGGGLFFPTRVELNVPLFRQADDRWGNDKLGPTPATLAAEGCAVASAAMVLASYGYDTDPGRLNAFLNTRDGFTPQGWIWWEKAAELSDGAFIKAYEDLPSYRLIDENLQIGNPVIVRLRAKDGITHFVVIAGKEGYDYLVRDPGAGAAKGLYPLREFGSKIEGLRFYARAGGK